MKNISTSIGGSVGVCDHNTTQHEPLTRTSKNRTEFKISSQKVDFYINLIEKEFEESNTISIYGIGEKINKTISVVEKLKRSLKLDQAIELFEIDKQAAIRISVTKIII